VETKGVKLLFDPFISPNGLAENINVQEVEADYLLITHGHQDHMADAESIGKRCGAKVVSTFEIVSYFGAKGLEGHPMNQGGKVPFDFGTVLYTKAVHSSSFPDGSYAGMPGGFVVWNDEGCFYHAGDTALTMDMKLIPMICPKLDFAILPIGNTFTMGYEDATHAADFIQCNQVIGCHYDTFGLIAIDKEAAVQHFDANGKSLILMDIGSTKTF